jgi:tol-pal system protein YbgF
MTRLGAFLTVFLLLARAASAQDDAGETGAADMAPAARLEVRISQLEEEIRRLRGMVEQNGYQTQQLKTQLDKNAGDVNYRLDALEKKPMVGTAQAAAQSAPEAGADEEVFRDPREKKSAASRQKQDGTIPEDLDAQQEAPAEEATPKHFKTPREQYNDAFNLLNHAKYAEAGAAFTDFTHAHPNDPLIGNAYYWLGETYYVRKNYLKAGDNFRQGYESLPTGPKAADNLLKLAMSLSALNKTHEACVVLRQIGKKYGETAPNTAARASQEANRVGCK